jgi:hypothetical protein
MDSADGQSVVNLLETRYISGDEAHPRRSYAYVTGDLSTYRERPQLVVYTVDQISDFVSGREDTPTADFLIAALLPDPMGGDAGFESVILRSMDSRATSLEGWQLKDRGGNSLALSGGVEAHGDREIRLAPGQLPLNNMGDELYLLGPDNKVQHQVAYTAEDVVCGERVWFLTA